MFGIDEVRLVANLEALRHRVCCYGSGPDDPCDCKFGLGEERATSETTGCPELRQAIKIISGQREDVLLTEKLFETNARNTLVGIKRLIEKAEVEP